MLYIDGKIVRNLEEQVQKNKDDIQNLSETTIQYYNFKNTEVIRRTTSDLSEYITQDMFGSPFLAFTEMYLEFSGNPRFIPGGESMLIWIYDPSSEVGGIGPQMFSISPADLSSFDGKYTLIGFKNQGGLWLKTAFSLQSIDNAPVTTPSPLVFNELPTWYQGIASVCAGLFVYFQGSFSGDFRVKFR